MFKSLSKPGAVSEVISGKAGGDSLLKELQSSPLDEWKVLRILHEHPHPGVQEYVCNRLPEVGEAIIERYLLQLIYLAVHKPGQHLERIILLLCARSFRIAIKTQWLLVALCQDHPKSRALEVFRDQAYKAALDGKWEVPIRSAKLDPLSPYNSAQLSPPFCSPTNSYMATHFANINPVGRDAAPQQPYRMPMSGYLDGSVATQPPGSMVMSPPGTSSSTGLGAAVKQAGDISAPAVLQRRGGAMPALTCLLPSEQRSAAGPVAAADAAAGAAGPPQQQQQRPMQHQYPNEADAAGRRPGWLDDSGVSAMAPAIRTSAPAAAHDAGVPTFSDAPAAAACDGGGGSASAALPPPAAAAATAPAPTATACVAAPVPAGAAAQPARHAASPSSAFSTGGGACIAERIQALKRELGEGEGVSALLERAKQQGMPTVAAPDDDALLSDDELSNRPMSPLSRLRFDTFGATLDFVEALCDASSSLTNYSQEERQRALRAGLDHINGEIEKTNRREVAIWFPMGRRGDRVLGIAAQEAVLLNSREKAPFMLFVEVLEGQNECGDECGAGADAFVDLTATFGADLKARLEALGGGGGGAGGLSASMLATNPGPKLEFGRRETYGIALTGIGAQHQLQYMHSTPGGAAALKAPEAGRQQQQQPQHGSKQNGQADGNLASERADSPPPQSGRPVDAAPVAAAPAGPGVLQPVRSHGGSGNLVCPTPTRVASLTHASLLEEQASALARRNDRIAATDAAPDGSVRSGGTASPAPATEVFIPTRSASSNNIAAAAAAVMAASASGGGSDSILAASARSSDAGAVGTGAANGGSCLGGGGLPQTPRSGSAASGLPPRPPSSSSSHQHQQLPVGGISPINAAKEVSFSSSGAEGGGLLGSNLLRRILGDRPEAAGASGGGSAGEGATSASSDASRFFTIAAAAGMPATAPSLATPPVYPSLKPLQAREPGSMGPIAAPRHGAAPLRLGGMHIMDGKLQELAALGVFGVHAQAKSDQEVMEALSNISASLRGEQPMVRVKILPLGPRDAGGGGSSGGGGGTGAAASSSFPGRVKAALLNLRRKTGLEDDAVDTAGAAPSVDGVSAAAVTAAAAAAEVTIPVASGGPAAAKQRLVGAAEQQQQLVRLVLCLPTQALNLDVKSPHRKSRRTPSHEAIEMMADKYKVYKLPPPPDFGPPLGPGPYGSGGCMGPVFERASEEGEGAAEDVAAPPLSQGTTLTTMRADGEAFALRYARANRAEADAAGTADLPQAAAIAPPPPPSPPVATGTEVAAAAILGPPLPPEWESRSPRAVRSYPAEAAPAPWSVSHQPVLRMRSGGDGRDANLGPETAATSASQPSSAGAWRVSPPMAVAEATAEAGAAGGFQPQSTALHGAPGGGAFSGSRPAGLPEKSAPSSDKPVEAGPGLSAVATAAAPPGAGLAASLQSSLTRILHRSAQQQPTQQQPQAPSESPSADGTVGVPDPTPRGGGPSTGAVAAGLGRYGSAAPGEVVAATAAAGPGPPAQRSMDAVCGEAVAKAQPPAVQGLPSNAAEGGGAGASTSSGSGLAASLHSSLNRILNRAGAGASEVASSALSSGSSGNGGPRGVSPVRGSAGSLGGGSGSGSLLQGAATAAAAAPAAPPDSQAQQRAGGTANLEVAPGPTAASSSGLAASLQSSLTRILNRSTTGQLACEGPSSAPGSGGGAHPPGPSPRGGSPVRGGASPVRGGSATSAGAGQHQAAGDAVPPAGPPTANGASNRLSKLLSRLQQDQQQPQPQPSSSSQQTLAAQQPKQPHHGLGRPMAVPPGRSLNGVLSDVATAAMAPQLPQPRSLPYGLPKVTDGRYERESLEERRRREAHAVYGERWAGKIKRIQRESPHGRRKGWALRCVIVKSGDDCRQELLALQLVRTFGDIFVEAGLPLWVRYYEVLVTSNRTALIEMVPNTLSIHTIKSRSPPGTSLSDHFFAKFGRSGTPECTAAQRRFTESLAAYSLICYLLQIKDRHNGNILIDDDGRVVHIDYGFLLSNSPGGVNFESAPFKLTRELLEVMDSNSDGRPSEMFDYFKVLMIQGFIAVRNHSDRILLLVKIMAKSGFPCFKGGERALKALEKRLMASLNEVQCVEHVLQLIAESLDAWRTRQYDYYQRVLNGIL